MRLFFFLFCFLFSCSAYAASCGSGSSCDWGSYSTSVTYFDCEADWQAASDADPWQIQGTHIGTTCGASHAYCNQVCGIPVGGLMHVHLNYPAKLQNVYVLCPGGDCAPPCDYQQAYDDAVASCGQPEFVVWEDVSECKWHCHQGDCEDEYQAAKQQCSSPRLVDKLTCEYSCACPAERAQAEEACTVGYYLDPDTCEWSCKCCSDLSDQCLQYCGGGSNVKTFTCSDSQHSGGGCTVDFFSYVPCECIVPPIDDPDPDPPDDGPHDCTDFEQSCLSSGCKPTCISDPETGDILVKNCDCDDDPKDPGPDGEEGTPDDEEKDDNANGWLKAIEENTDRTANIIKDAVGKSNEWLEAVKHNTDTIIENDKKYFLDNDGHPYLKKISDGVDGLGASIDGLKGSIDDLKITTAGVSVGVVSNEYSNNFVDQEGYSELLEDTFEQELTDYIASGIPLITYVKETTLNLSSATSSLSFNVLGKPVNVNLAPYQSSLSFAGDILFALTILSSFILIIRRG